MADASPHYARIYRADIFGYIWLAPVGCHLNVGLVNLAYKYLLQGNLAIADRAVGLIGCGFLVPVYLLLIVLWVSMLAVQFHAFSNDGHYRKESDNNYSHNVSYATFMYTNFTTSCSRLSVSNSI